MLAFKFNNVIVNSIYTIHMEFHAPRRAPRVQNRERDGGGDRDGDVDAQIQAGQAAGGDRARASITGLPRFTEGLQLAGPGAVHITPERILAGAKTGPDP